MCLALQGLAVKQPVALVIRQPFQFRKMAAHEHRPRAILAQRRRGSLEGRTRSSGGRTSRESDERLNVQTPHRTPATTRMPKTIMIAPATRATINPDGPIFSTRTNAVSAATHTRFMTPTTNSKHINSQQQPRQ